MKKLTYRVVDKDDFYHPALQDQGDLWEDIRAESPEHAAQKLCQMVDKEAEQVYQKAGRATFLVDCPDGSRLTILVKVKKQVCYLPERLPACDNSVAKAS
jgi:hypothetical protein